jgi:hypothetical protein
MLIERLLEQELYPLLDISYRKIPTNYLHLHTANNSDLYTEIKQQQPLPRTQNTIHELTWLWYMNDPIT